MGYSANDVINKLKQEDNIDISARTINYYAYDKKMFPDLQKGKSCFSDREVELIKRIVYLKNRTSLSLDEIKECIQDDYKYLTTTSDIVNTALSEAITRGISSDIAQTFSVTRPNNTYDENDNVVYCNMVSSCSSHTDNLSNTSFCKSNLNFDNNLPYSNTISTANCSTSSTMQSFPEPICSLESKDISYNEQQTVKINSDVTITVSNKVSREQLIDIINYINSKTN